MSLFDADHLDWLRGGDTGISSMTILEVMTGIPASSHSVPWDPGDFGRCRRLLARFPAFRARLPEVAVRFPEWTALVEAWDELDALWEQEAPSGMCPRLYDRMKALRP